MVGFLTTPTTLPAFHTQLPHGLLLDADEGILLLETPERPRGLGYTQTLALGAVWAMAPRNIAVLDDTTCLDLSGTHEHLLRTLPLGAALQGIMTIHPATTAPGWEAARQGVIETAIVAAQRAAIQQGLPHQEPHGQACLRQIETLCTLRLPLTVPDPALPGQIRT